VTNAEIQLNSVLVPRLLFGWIVLICAEAFSGASLGSGFWSAWTLIVTYWLYFGHFFLFTTLAILTGRTSLPSLYLWGVLFGLYESWITKVIWSGYGADGKFALGQIGPYGFSELSMVFIFHPVVSFLLPLAVACVLCPGLRRWFPDLGWLTGLGRWARVTRIYMIVSFGLVMGMNSGGTLNLALNVVFMLAVLAILWWLACPALAVSDGRTIVAFGRWGFTGLCLYLALLYGLTYRNLRPEALPSVGVQGLTFVFYAVAIGGLVLHRGQQPLSASAASFDTREQRTVALSLAMVIGMGFLVSFVPKGPVLYVPVVVNFLLWSIGGFVLAGVALWAGTRESPGSLPSLS
jgi:hypothetical protein